MRVYRVKKRNDRQMAPFGRILGSASLRSNVVGLASIRLLIGKRNLNGFSPDLRSKHPTDRSSVLTDHTPYLDDKSSLISGFWTPAGYQKRAFLLFFVIGQEWKVKGDGGSMMEQPPDA